MRKYRAKFVRTIGEPPPLFSGVLTVLGKSDEMGVRDFLRRTKNLLRNRSKARSEIENPSGVGPSVPRPIESTPDLRIDPLTMSLTSRGPESNGMHAASSQVILLTALLFG